MINTKAFNSWDLFHTKLQVGNENPLTYSAQTNLFKFQPELPFIYFPTDQWTYFAAEINSIYSDQGYNICNVKTNVCKFKSNCQAVPQKNWRLRFTVENVDYTVSTTKTYEISIDPNDMLYPGTELGETDD